MSRLERYLWSAALLLLPFTACELLAGWLPAGAQLAREGVQMFAAALVLLWWRFARPRAPVIRRVGWNARAVRARTQRAANRLLVAGNLRSRAWRPTHGLPVVLCGGGPKAARDEVIARLESVLDALRAMSPARYERLRRLDPVIFVWPGRRLAVVPGSNALVLGRTLVREEPAPVLAALLAKQLVLLRLDHLGIVPSPWIGNRVSKLLFVEADRRLRPLIDAQDPSAAVRAAQWLLAATDHWVWRSDGSRARFDSPSRRKMQAAVARLVAT